MKFDKRILGLFFVGYFILQMLLTYPEVYISDEGTHVLIGLFFRDVIKNSLNFNSFNDFTSFATDFIVKYPKITPSYPPLYHLLLAGLLSVSESMFLLKMFNVVITILTAFIIYKLSFEFIRNKNIAIVSSIFFLSFAAIFHYADMILMDILQVLVFSLTLFYYLKIKNSKKFTFKKMVLMSILLAVAFMTKFFSLFLIPIILLDSFFYSKKFFRHCILSLLLSLVLISPYLFFYVKFGLYKLAFSIATTPFGNKFVYFDIFTNFGIFIGWFVALSIIWFFIKNYRNPFIVTWLIIPLIILLSFQDSNERFAFFLMPLYAMTASVTLSKIKQKRNFVLYLIISLIALQLIYNIYVELNETKYSVNDVMKTIKGTGNILIVSEEPVYSSVYILYGYLNGVDGNIFRPCILQNNNLTDSFVKEWGIKYIIDQENKISAEKGNDLQLKLIDTELIDSTTVRIFETDVEEKVDCNYVCILQGKVCKNQGFSRVLELIHNVGSAKSD